jgi:hypothetical protein
MICSFDQQLNTMQTRKAPRLVYSMRLSTDFGQDTYMNNLESAVRGACSSSPPVKTSHGQTQYLQYWRGGHQMIQKLLGTLFILCFHANSTGLTIPFLLLLPRYVLVFIPAPITNNRSSDAFHSRSVEKKQGKGLH